MAKLEHSVYVAPAKPVVSDDFPPGEEREMWSPTASMLIHGERDAVPQPGEPRRHLALRESLPGLTAPSVMDTGLRRLAGPPQFAGRVLDQREPGRGRAV